MIQKARRAREEPVLCTTPFPNTKGWMSDSYLALVFQEGDPGAEAQARW